MEVVTDAAPLPPRSSSQELNDQDQEKEELTKDIPDSETFNSRNGPKSNPRHGCKGSRPRPKGNNIQIIRGHNFVVGNVINFGGFGVPTCKSENRKVNSPQGTTSSCIAALRAYPEEASNEDFIIISESIDDKELESLCNMLGIDDSEINRVKFNHGQNGISEVIYHCLQIWKQHNTGENKSPMLNILCDKLDLIGSSGCKKALIKLFKSHF